MAVALARPANGQATMRLIDPIDSLRNMREIGVVVEDMPALQNLLTAEALKGAVERRLRQAGITVPADDKTKDPVAAFAPYLYVNVNVVKEAQSGFVYSIILQFKRAVEVHNVDSNRNFLFATTWDKGALGIVPLGEYRSIQRSLDEFVTAFLNDYLIANAKK
jgi:hypothetical protein